MKTPRVNGPTAVPAPPQRPNGAATMTEMERLQMENYALRHNLLQQQMQQVIAERTGYIKKLEAEHPGYAWDERQGLIPRQAMTPPEARPQEVTQ